MQKHSSYTGFYLSYIIINTYIVNFASLMNIIIGDKSHTSK